MFDFEKFSEKIYKNFSKEFSKEEINEILNLGEDYNKDTPDSIGKRLIINRIKINGTKNTGEIIDFDRNLYSGVNVFIADNLSGKSSIFNIIKYALTGSKSLKKDVDEWVDEAFIEISIGVDVYTIYLDLTAFRLSGGVYKVDLDTFLDNDKNLNDELNIQFEFNSIKNLKENIESFFFNKFSYYSLKWTSKSGSKKKSELKENPVTWKTYFKSIYLESKNYDNLFLSAFYGSQDKKILEMILGLKLTYPINRLRINNDFLNFKLAKRNDIHQENQEEKNSIDSLKLELKNIEDHIRRHKEKIKKEVDKQDHILKYNRLSNEILELKKKIMFLKEENRSIEKVILKTKKNIIKVKEHIEFGVLFSNLDVTVCPRCEHEVDDNKRKLEKETKKCMLCNTDVQKKEVDKEFYKDKLEELKHQLAIMEDKKANTQCITPLENTYQEHLKQLKNIEKSIQIFAELNEDIKLEKLLYKKGEIKFRIKMIKNNEEKTTDQNKKLEKKIEVLDYAINELEGKRINLSKDIFEKLEALILKQISKFGLDTIENVNINKSLNITFTQNSCKNNFNDLTEGEQLRVKIAFFLSLIQLDMIYKVGRHPRLLIIDSPGKEEIINKDLKELSKVFRTINNELGDKLQIIIGTALSEFKEATEVEKIEFRKKGEFVF